MKKFIIASLLLTLSLSVMAQEVTPSPAPLPAATPAPTPSGDGFKVSAQLGGSVAMSSSASSLLTPIARLNASGPLAVGNVDITKLPILHVEGELSALPGDTISKDAGLSGTLAQFKALEFTIGISHRVSQWLPLNNGKQSVATSVYVEGGFATRLDNELKARDKAPRYGCAGLRFDEKMSSSFLKTGICLDQRLDGKYNITTTITALATPFEFGSGAGVSIYVKAILGIDASTSTRPELNGSKRDSVMVGSTIGW